MTEPLHQFRSALSERYRIERELGRGHLPEEMLTMKPSTNRLWLSTILSLAITGCGSDSPSGPDDGPAPLPILQSIAPTTGLVGGPEFVLTATGREFRQNSNILWNGSALATTYVDETTLTATIGVGLLTAPGTFEVAVRTPAPGGGQSASLPFPVVNPVPNVSGTSPTSVIWRSGDFTLTVSGTGFVSTSEILWNGVAQSTTFQDPFQLVTTIAGDEIVNVGAQEVAVRNPPPGGGTSAIVSFEVTLDPAITSYHTVALQAADVVYDPVGGLLYTSVVGTDLTYPNTVLVIDPSSAAVIDQIAVGSEPGPLALTDDGQYLYVGLGGAPEVQRITLASRTVDLAIGLGADPFFGPYYAEDLVAVPGSPTQVVVSRYRKGFTPRHGGVVIFDDAVQRPNATQDHTGSNRIEPSAIGSLLYGYNNETTEFGLREIAITAAGLAEGMVWSNRVSGFGVDIAFADGNIFSTTGVVVDAATGTVVGTFPLDGARGPVAPDPANGRALFVIEGQPAALEAYRVSTAAQIASVAVPGGGFRRLVRWGPEGLAYVGDDELTIITTLLVTQ